METGDPLAGTERNEVSAKNNGVRGILDNRIEFLPLSYPTFHYSIIPYLQVEPETQTSFLQVAQKGPDTRLPKLGTRPKGGESKRSADKFRGMSRTGKYVAMTRDEGNAALRPRSGP